MEPPAHSSFAFFHLPFIFLLIVFLLFLSGLRDFVFVVAPNTYSRTRANFGFNNYCVNNQ